MNPAVAGLLQVVGGLALLLVGGEILVRGASALAVAMRISPLVIGLTVVAFGTSAPELAVTLRATLAGKAELGVGNAVGSNIFNVLFILGLSALITPLVVSSRLIRWDVPLMILASAAILVIGWDGRIGRADGVFLFTGLLAYTIWAVVQSRRENREVQDEFAAELPPRRQGLRPALVQTALIIAGLALLGGGSHWLVGGATGLARMMGVSNLILGLTVIAAGTSLPEVVTSLVASLRGERDIAVGNVVGSNLFNLLGVLGLSALLAPSGMPVPAASLRFDIPVMLAAAVACLPIFYTGHLIARWEGGLFFGYYLAYLAALILDATQNHLSRSFSSFILFFALPLTGITLGLGVYRSVRSRSLPPSELSGNPGEANRHGDHSRPTSADDRPGTDISGE